MKRKWHGLGILTLSGMMAAGCSLSGEAASKTVTLSENVKLESALDESHLLITHEATIPIEIPSDYTGFKGNQLYFNQHNATYLYDVESKDEKKVMEAPFYLLSENEQRALSHVNEKFYVHDLQNGTKKFVGEGTEEWSTFFGDSKGSTVIQVKNTSEGFTVEKTVLETEQKFSWDIDELFDSNGMAINTFQSSEEGIYIAGNSLKEGYGLYHLLDNGEVKQVSSLEGISSMGSFQFLDEQTIIFNEEYNGKTGIYTLNLSTGNVTQLVAGGKDKEGIWVPFYKLSPDKSKILFDTPVQVGKEYKTNVYVAEFVEGQLSKPTLLMQNADLYAVISMTGYWSDDSSTAYISTTAPGNDTIDAIEVYSIQSEK
ncbi:TolB family protein [Sporosarcina koreensis]|uniref:TolB family protein n=1 Tax=Sporosarcina koreensis TaxID=334735 RepID=A0ABW0TY56_9BACL